EVVHGGVNDGETFAAVALEVEDAGEERAGRAHDAASGFEQEVELELAEWFGDGARVGGGAGGEVVETVFGLRSSVFGHRSFCRRPTTDGRRRSVRDAQAAAGVYVADVVARGAEARDERGDALHG